MDQAATVTISEVILTSERDTTKANALNGIGSVETNAPNARIDDPCTEPGQAPPTRRQVTFRGTLLAWMMERSNRAEVGHVVAGFGGEFVWWFRTALRNPCASIA